MSEPRMESLRLKDNESLAVCVPSHGRPELVSKALSALANSMRRLDRQPSVLVLINGPMNYASQVEATFIDKFDDLSVVHDEVPGLARARNVALELVTTDWLAFLDDDAIPDESWVPEALKAIQRRPGVIAIGGPYFRTLEPGFRQPRWLPIGYGTWDQGHRECVVETVPGGNMIIHRQSALALGGFREEFGMRGDARLWGEESELQRRAKEHGLLTIYVPTLRISHLLHGDRLSFRGALIEEWQRGLQAHAVKRWNNSFSLILGSVYSFGRALGFALILPVRVIVAPLLGRKMIAEACHCLLSALNRSGQAIGSLREIELLRKTERARVPPVE